MREGKYHELFDMLGIRVQPLDEYYNPDEYGKRLMNTINSYEGVVYSDSTTPLTPEVVMNNR